MGGEYSNESRNALTFVLVKLLALVPLFNTQKKHVLNYLLRYPNTSFAKPCYFYLLQEIKDDLEPRNKYQVYQSF